MRGMAALREFDVAFYDFTLEFWFWWSNKWLLTKKNCVEKNSWSPNVNCWTWVFLFANNLWTHICRSSTKRSKFLLFILCLSCESKINNLRCVVWTTHVNQNIFHLYISMWYIKNVIVSHSFNNLCKNCLAYRFWQVPLGKSLCSLLSYNSWKHFTFAGFCN